VTVSGGDGGENPTGDDFDSFRCRSGFSSPPCLAAEIAPDYFDPLAVDPAQARDVARWRKAERERLRALRMGLSASEREACGAAFACHLTQILRDRFDGARWLVLSAYWPIKGEPDLRPLMAELHGAGVKLALPVVETKSAPLKFRRWTPKTHMVRGDWNIPVPPADAEAVRPDITLAPLVGWTGDGYRLGYGGGYFGTGRSRHSGPAPWSSGWASRQQGSPPSIRNPMTRHLTGQNHLRNCLFRRACCSAGKARHIARWRLSSAQRIPRAAARWVPRF